MASITGLQSGDFTDIDVLYTISINGDAGQTGQVLSSDGTNTLWINGSAIDREDLTAADSTITISGGSYDGAVARTIQTNKVPNALTFTGTATGTYDGSAALSINLTDNDNQLVLSEGSGITITNLGGFNRRIAANIDADTINFSGTDLAVSKVPNALTFTGTASGTYDGSAALTINLTDTNTQLNLTEGNGISIVNTGGVNRTISAKPDEDTIDFDGDELTVLKVPEGLSAGTNLSYSSGSTFDGESARTINLDESITSMTSIAFKTDSTTTSITGNSYPSSETAITNCKITDTSNIVSPYFFVDVYDPSGADADSLSTSFSAIFSSNLSNTFTAKATSCIISLQVFNYSISSNRWLYLQLGDASGTEWSSGTNQGGYGTGTRATNRNIHYCDETDKQTETVEWYLSGLSIGTTYTVNPMAKTSSTLNYIYAGGSYPASILKGYYLPSAGI